MANSFINGKTGVYGLMGDPVDHSFSPCIHSKIFESIDENSVYVTFPTKKESVGEAVKGAFALGIRGMNVTVPHKVSVMDYLAEIDDTACVIGAVNTLKPVKNGFKGYNTDVIGVEYSFSSRGIELGGKVCLLLGAGGAAKAVAYAMLKGGVKRLYIANRTLAKADALKNRLKTYFQNEIITLTLEEAENIKDTEIIINATTIGFGEKTGLSPLSENFFEDCRAEVCMDVIYTPWETELLRLAAAKGIRCINGFDMLVYQGTAASEIWHDEKFPPGLLNKLKKELTEVFKENERGKTNE